jgi:hypothetical protein
VSQLLLLSVWHRVAQVWCASVHGGCMPAAALLLTRIACTSLLLWQWWLPLSVSCIPFGNDRHG